MVCLLGIPHLQQDQQRLELPRERPLWLLAYLAAQGDWVSRQELLELFWPDVEENIARNNLRQLLHRTRKLEWVEALEAEPDGVRWQAPSDVRLFRQALSQSDWAKAVQLYQGRFLQGLRIYDLPNLENWLEAEREDLQSAWQNAALRHVDELERQQDFAAALPVLEKILEADPYAETALQRYLRLAPHSQQSQRARNIYESFCARLREEMGLEPDPSTRALVATLEAEPIAAAQTPKPHHNLPSRLTAFVGREPELVAVREQLENPACRLLTLVGPGGIGKTRLSLQAAEAQIGDFAGGICFVGLASVESSERLVDAIARALQLNLSASEEPRAQLLNFLRPQEVLLLLDNFEHLMDGVGLVQEILEQAPLVKVLVTSRQSLGLQAEWVMVLEGLSYPLAASLEQARASSAIKLFVERASRVQTGFALSAQTLTPLLRICQLTGGWPLALELAAIWVNVLSLEEIAGEIAQSLNFLESTEPDRPERHQSLRVVFEQSWRRLSAEEQRVLSHLSLFRGGFERQAAQAVAQASPRILLGLVGKSLLRRHASGRFGMLEVIRQYALEKLKAGPTAYAKAQQLHADWFLRFAETAEPQTRGAEQALWLERLSLEHDNLRSALTWLLSQNRSEEALRLVVALNWFWYVRGHIFEGRDWLEAALALSGPSAPPELRASALDGLAEKAKDLGDYVEAAQHQQQALGLWQSTGNQQRISGALHTLGLIARDQGDYPLALSHFEQSLVIKRKLGDQYGIGTTLNDIGILHAYSGQTEQSVPFFEESLAMKRSIGDQQGVAYALGNLSNVLSQLGDKERAQVLLEESLALKRGLGDQQGIAVSLTNLAQGALETEELEKAWAYMREAFEVFYGLGRRWNMAYILPMFVAHALLQSQPLRAAKLIGLTYGLSESLGLSEPPGNPNFLNDQIQATQDCFSAEDYQQALKQGRAMKLEQAVAYVLQAGQ